MLKNLSTTYDYKSPEFNWSNLFKLYGWNGLKAQKLLAQGIALGNYERNPVAL